MTDLIIIPEEKTPGIDLSDGVIIFHGRSIVNDPKVFFEPVLSWIRMYIKNPAEVTVVTFKLEYIDSKSAQAIFQILRLLKDMSDNGHVIIVNWYYAFGDIEMLELGEVIQVRLEMEFEFNEFEHENTEY